jgi:YebC/PmpR family DNA-binding regulatory protein
MSGHSKWETTKRQKAVVDARRGAVFTRIGNQIAIAARSGIDPAMNAALAMIVEKAKQANMPASNIQRAIDRVSDKNAAVLEEVTYEAVGPGGVGILIETATDNRNRTLPEVKNALTKNGGRIADTGSVMFQFTRKGVIRVAQTNDDALLAVIDAGAEDTTMDDDELVVYTNQKDLAKVRKAIIDAGLTVTGAELQYIPNLPIEVSDPEIAQKIIKLLDALDDVDDVTAIHHNANITADI